MRSNWQELASRLEQAGARLAATAPDDLPRLEAVLGERREIVGQLAELVEAEPGGASPAALKALHAALETGRRYRLRLRLQAELLRLQLAAETSRGRLLSSFAGSAREGRGRISLRS